MRGKVALGSKAAACGQFGPPRVKVPAPSRADHDAKEREKRRAYARMLYALHHPPASATKKADARLDAWDEHHHGHA